MMCPVVLDKTPQLPQPRHEPCFHFSRTQLGPEIVVLVWQRALVTMWEVVLKCYN